jgi:hypothetical protein
MRQGILELECNTTIRFQFGKPNAEGSQEMRVTLRAKNPANNVDFVGRSTGFGKTLVINRGPRDIKVFAGRRDDPFFFDLIGFQNVLDLGGRSFVGCGSANSHPENDTFKGQNVSSIVIELPSSLLRGGGDTKIGVWATTNVGDTQIDRMGRPAINTVFIPNNPFHPTGSRTESRRRRRPSTTANPRPMSPPGPPRSSTHCRPRSASTTRPDDSAAPTTPRMTQERSTPSPRSCSPTS